MENEIVGILEKIGPSFPAQISREMRRDLMLVSAVLSEMKSKDKIKATTRPVGSSLIYYLEKDEAEAKNILFKSLNDIEKKFVLMMKNYGAVYSEELGSQERFLAKNLRDFIIEKSLKINNYEKNVFYFVNLNDIQAVEIIRKRTEPSNEKEEKSLQKTIEDNVEKNLEKPLKEISEMDKAEERNPQKTLKQIPEKPKEENNEIKFNSDFEKKIGSFFENKSMSVKKSLGDKKNPVYIASLSYPLGEQEFYVSAKSKKSIKEEDILLLFCEAKKMKLPLLFITNGNLTKKCDEYVKKEFGSFVKIAKI